MARLALLALALFAASPAFAHDGEHAAGLVSGFAHPFSGIDHLLAMIAVGLWAAQSGGRAIWLLPVSFPVAMAIGAVIGAAGLGLPGVEAGIALSVLALGLLIAFAVRMPALAGTAVVTVFAILHGHAHGTELPAAGDPLSYGAGFVAATAALHAIGISLGLAFKSAATVRLVRAAGAAIAMAGVVLVLAL